MERKPGSRAMALDLDDAVIDLGDLELEEAAQDVLVGAGDDDLGALGGLADLEDEELETLGVAIALGGDLLGEGHDGLGAAEVEDDVAGLEAGDDGGDELALLVGVLGEDDLALGLAETLHDDLLGGLGGDAAGIGGGDLVLDDAAELDVGADAAGLFQRVLGVGVLELVVGDGGVAGEDVDVAGGGGDADGEVKVGEMVLLEGGDERRLDGGEDQVAGEVALGGKLRNGNQELTLGRHHAPPLVSVPSPRSGRPRRAPEPPEGPGP